MTTSSDNRIPDPRPSGDHWLELTATLSPELKAEFGEWIGKELEVMVDDLKEFSTPESRRKSLRR